VILVVAGLYFLAGVFCFTLPPAPPPASLKEEHHGLGVGEAEAAVGSTFAQLREGLSFVRENPSIGWSLVYLGITASLVGVLGVLGPAFAKETLGLTAKDFAVVILPLGFGIVMGILLLNSYGRYFARRRVIEGGLIALGILLAALSAAGPISQLFQRADAPGGLDLSIVTSLLSVVVVIAFFAGIAYGLVAIPAQTQLQEDLPEDVRGRVFGILGMLVSVASFLPILIVAPLSDVVNRLKPGVGTTAVLFVLSIGVLVVGIVSVVTRGPIQPSEARPAADPNAVDPIASASGRTGNVERTIRRGVRGGWGRAPPAHRADGGRGRARRFDASAGPSDRPPGLSDGLRRRRLTGGTISTRSTRRAVAADPDCASIWRALRASTRSPRSSRRPGRTPAARALRGPARHAAAFDSPWTTRATGPWSEVQTPSRSRRSLGPRP
jgi:hypothetical protein